jgi:glycosyltransferase involved in cell wall biosynthesis
MPPLGRATGSSVSAPPSPESVPSDPIDDGRLETDPALDDLAARLLSRATDTARQAAQGRRLKYRPTVSVVIPAINEEPNLWFVLPSIGHWIDEVILVDGGSTDGTCQTAQALLPNLRVVEQQGSGKGAAQRSGFAAATGDIIISLDADGSMDPKEIPAFVGALVSGAEFVKGTRFTQGAGSADLSFTRRIGNRGLVWFARLLFGGRFSDITYGYIAFWKRVLPQITPGSNGFELEVEMALRALHAGLRVAEVPSFEQRRIHGKSNLRALPDGWQILKLIMREKRAAQQPAST